MGPRAAQLGVSILHRRCRTKKQRAAWALGRGVLRRGGCACEVARWAPRIDRGRLVAHGRPCKAVSRLGGCDRLPGCACVRVALLSPEKLSLQELSGSPALPARLLRPAWQSWARGGGEGVGHQSPGTHQSCAGRARGLAKERLSWRMDPPKRAGSLRRGESLPAAQRRAAPLCWAGSLRRGGPLCGRDRHVPAFGFELGRLGPRPRADSGARARRGGGDALIEARTSDGTLPGWASSKGSLWGVQALEQEREKRGGLSGGEVGCREARRVECHRGLSGARDPKRLCSWPAGSISRGLPFGGDAA